VQETVNLRAIAEDESVDGKLHEQPMSELAGDKGHHSKQTMIECARLKIRTYTAEPQRGEQQWKGETEARDVLHANRRRINSDRGKWQLQESGDFVERSFAHYYETAAIGRLHLSGRERVSKRVLVHAARFNLRLMRRVSYGLKQPRGLTRGVLALVFRIWKWLKGWRELMASIRSVSREKTELAETLHAMRLRSAA
jgi:hypothetical protein